MIKAVWNYFEIPVILLGAHAMAGLTEYLLTLAGV